MCGIEYKIYKHTNKIDGKVYIGVTKQSLEDRYAKGGGYKGCTIFYNAIQKYGWDNFDHEILDTAHSIKEASEKERYWIEYYNSTNRDKGYNLDKGGYEGKEFSEETRKRMSEAKLGEKNDRYGKEVSKETRYKISQSNIGKHKGTLNSMYGKTHTEEVKKRLSEVNSVEKPDRYKPVYCITTNRFFISIKEVGDIYKINTAHISDVCKGKRKYCGRDPDTNELLEWRYATDEEKTILFKQRGLERFLNA